MIVLITMIGTGQPTCLRKTVVTMIAGMTKITAWAA